MAIKQLIDLSVDGTVTVSGSVSSPGDLVTLYNTNNGQGAGIRFSDQNNSSQKGFLKFFHSDGASHGGGSSFKLTSTEDDLVLAVGDADATHGRVAVWSGTSNTEPDYGFAQDPNTGMLRTGSDAIRFVTGGSAVVDFDSSQNADFSGNVEMQSGNSVGKFAVSSSSVHGSYDFYNNGTSYFNGDVTVDANFTQTSGTSASFSGNVYLNNVDTNTSSETTILVLNGSTKELEKRELPANNGAFQEIDVSAGQVAFGDGTGLNGDGHLYWDSTNNRLGIGTTSPAADLHIEDAGNSQGGIRIEAVGSANTDTVNMHFQGQAGTAPFYISRAATGGAEIQIQADGDLILNGTNGDNVGIGTTNPQQKLDVNGNALLRGNVYFTSGTSNYYSGSGGGFKVFTQSTKQFEVDYNGYLQATKYGDGIYLGLSTVDNLVRTTPGFSNTGKMIEASRFYTTKIEPGGWPTASGHGNAVNVTPTISSSQKMWIKGIWIHKSSSNSGSSWGSSDFPVHFIMENSAGSFDIIGGVANRVVTLTTQSTWYYQVAIMGVPTYSGDHRETNGMAGKNLKLMTMNTISSNNQPTWFITVEYTLVNQTAMKNNVDQTLT